MFVIECGVDEIDLVIFYKVLIVGDECKVLEYVKVLKEVCGS